MSNWGKLAARGPLGMFLVVLSTAWWATSVKSTEEWHAFNDVVDDVWWVLKNILKLSPGPSSPNITQVPPVNQQPAPIPPCYMHAQGEHQLKLSCQAREAYS